MKNVKYIWFLLIIPIICIYYQTINFEFTIDDHNLIVDKVSEKITTINDLLNFFDTNYNNRDYRPITMISFGIEDLIIGSLKPSISHGVNIALFLIIVFFLISIFKKLFHLESKHSTKVTFFAILLFACHPLCVEVVASSKSRDGLLSMLFSLVSLFFYLQFLNKKKALYLIPTLLFFGVALMAKLDAMGCLLFMSALYFYKNGFEKKALTKGMLLVFSLMLVVNLFYGIKRDRVSIIDEDSKIGLTVFTENNMYDKGGLHNKIGFAVQSHTIYFSKIIFPIYLRYYYGYAYYQLKTFWTFKVWLLLISHLIILYLLLKYYRNHPVIILSLFGYISYLAYALNFVTAVAGIVADRYTFMALPWFLLILVYITKDILERNKIEKIFIPLNAVFTITLFIISYHRTAAWKSDLSLIERDAPFLEKSYEGMRIAANVYKEASDNATSKSIKIKYLNKAIYCAQKANKVYPDNTLMHGYEGTYHFAKGDLEKALLSFKRAYKTDSLDFHTNTFLGDTYYQMSNLKSALKYYNKAFRIDSNNYVLINNIGTIYYEMGEIEKCLDFSKSIIEKDSTNIAAWENLGYFYLVEKDTLKAINYFRKAAKLGMPLEMSPLPL